MPDIKAELEQVRAAIAERDQKRRDYQENWERTKLEGLRTRLLAGKVEKHELPCWCDVCVSSHLRCEHPDPERCANRKPPARPEDPYINDDPDANAQGSWRFAKEHTGPLTLNFTSDSTDDRRKRG